MHDKLSPFVIYENTGILSHSGYHTERNSGDQQRSGQTNLITRAPLRLPRATWPHPGRGPKTSQFWSGHSDWLLQLRVWNSHECLHCSTWLRKIHPLPWHTHPASHQSSTKFTLTEGNVRLACSCQVMFIIMNGLVHVRIGKREMESNPETWLQVIQRFLWTLSINWHVRESGTSKRHKSTCDTLMLWNSAV